MNQDDGYRKLDGNVREMFRTVGEVFGMIIDTSGGLVEVYTGDMNILDSVVTATEYHATAKATEDDGSLTASSLMLRELRGGQLYGKPQVFKRNE